MPETLPNLHVGGSGAPVRIPSPSSALSHATSNFADFAAHPSQLCFDGMEVLLPGLATPLKPQTYPAVASLPTWVHSSSRIATEVVQPSVVDPSTYRAIARITRKGILTYLLREGGVGNAESLVQARAKLTNHGFSGTWSRKSKSKVRRIAEGWMYGVTALMGDVWDPKAADLASRRYTLLTTTLSAEQAHTDQQIRRLLLMPFLQDLKRKHHAANYMWFAEKQGNGNIHLHIILDRFIPKDSARALWNKAQARHGYIERYRAAREVWHAGGFRYDAVDSRSKSQQLYAYQEGVRTQWGNPNSTDIRQVQGADAVMAYVVEYCAKGSIGEAGSVKDKLEGHLWGCNRELGKLSRYEVEITPELDAVIRNGEEAGRLRKVEGERWRYYAGDVARELAYELPAMFRDFRSHWRAEGLKLPSRRGLRRSSRGVVLRATGVRQQLRTATVRTTPLKASTRQDSRLASYIAPPG